MNTAETPRQRLARLMDERRSDLHLTWNEVADRAGVTREGLRRMRTGTGHIRSLTKRGIERALAWESGSVETVLAGGEPAVRDQPGSAMDRAEAIMDENERLVQLVVERFRRLNRKKRDAVVQLLDVLEDDPPGEAEKR